MSDDKKNALRERPLSPHLTIYKPQITSVLSITHRGTGVFLLIGAFVLVLWLLALAAGPETCQCINAALSTFVGKLFLLGWVFSLYFHLCNGIRHMFWDIGKGYELTTVTITGWLVVIVAAGLTAFSWTVTGVGF